MGNDRFYRLQEKNKYTKHLGGKVKKIYIILTMTGTMVSRIVKVYTRKKYGHVSISLDKKLKNMYSFGRLKATNPFVGGFVHESKNQGTFYRFKDTTATIYSLEIEDEKYEKLEKEIEYFKKTRREYGFNAIGLFAVAAHLKIKRKNKYYCAEFVQELLERAGVHNEFPNIIKPEDFLKIPGLKKVYDGYLRDYTVVNKKVR